jgi:hypothetical protein
MFSREELLAALLQLLESPSPSLTVVAFGQFDFQSPSSEESLAIHRGRRADFDNALHFWVGSLRSRGWEGRESYLLPYLQSGKCRPITEAEFNSLVSNYSAALKVSLPLPLHPGGGFVAAAQMYDSWDDVAALAEFEDEFVAFYWDTTA